MDLDGMAEYDEFVNGCQGVPRGAVGAYPEQDSLSRRHFSSEVISPATLLERAHSGIDACSLAYLWLCMLESHIAIVILWFKGRKWGLPLM